MLEVRVLQFAHKDAARFPFVRVVRNHASKVVAEGQKVHCAFLQDTLIVWVPVQYDIIVPIIVQHGLRVAPPRHDVLKKEVQLVGLHGG